MMPNRNDRAFRPGISGVCLESRIALDATSVAPNPDTPPIIYDGMDKPGPSAPTLIEYNIIQGSIGGITGGVTGADVPDPFRGMTDGAGGGATSGIEPAKDGSIPDPPNPPAPAGPVIAPPPPSYPMNVGDFLNGYTWGADGRHSITADQIDPATGIPLGYSPGPDGESGESGFLVNMTLGTIATGPDGIMYEGDQFIMS